MASGVVTVAQGSACRVTIEEAGARGRTVEVVPVSGSVALKFTPKSKPGLPVSEESAEGLHKKLDVMKEGGELLLTCRIAISGGSCRNQAPVRATPPRV